MAKQSPVFIHPTLGTPVQLTKAMAVALAKQARQHGHLRRGYDQMAGADAVEVSCPLCRDFVRGWHGRYATCRTPTQALDRAMVEHLAHDCLAVARPE
jgi:hypothetical protein